jgi:hypothetical protein
VLFGRQMGVLEMLVYVTQSGSRYHSRTDLACLEKARGTLQIEIQLAADGGLQPCLTCDAPLLPASTEGDLRWLRAIDDWHKSSSFDSFWEEAFARRVLAKTPGVSVDDLELQAYVPTREETYKVDFFIPSMSIICEIDGYAKDGTPPTPSEMEKRNRRDANLQNQGFSVLHFSNTQVQQEPANCIQILTKSLEARSAKKLAPAPNPHSEGTPAADAATAVSPRPSRLNGKWLTVGVLAIVAIAIAATLLAVQSSGSSDEAGQVLAESTQGLEVPDASDTAATPITASVMPPGVEPISKDNCPTSHPFKGNISRDNEKIVHAPGQQFYDKTDPEKCFESIDSAIAAGYRETK